ncbi:thiol:disulfide interchange protein DsbA/DsbL [Marinicella meishanensis]|uniref:thiol:disulfide interchange protein DsbA/DsbL n=1 Tax=Marinicella meishanensis TaxID=2873263 RepID=UPI001CBD7061|nr:thiol:disulfide interchange protein DsbA/DsbL [Marinicella sp. NBU2979]
MRILLFWSLVFALHSAQANPNDVATAASPWQAGVHYELITPSWTAAEEGPVVYEFFSYMCPGCNAFEPYMKQLTGRLAEGQTIVRVPVAFYAQWEPHAKAYHALEIMEQLDGVHESLFAAIHQHKKALRSVDDIADWLAVAHGIDRQQFVSTANSFAVDQKMRQAKKMAQAMGISRVPSLVVNGREKPDFDQLKTPDNILQATVDLLNQ